MNKEKLKKYPKTDKFECIDTLGVPHPYCVGARHVGHAADHHGGMLGKEAIESGERQGIRCCMRDCNLDYAGHETAVLIEVDDDRDLQDIDELNPYLLSIKALAEADGAAGFAFKQKGH